MNASAGAKPSHRTSISERFSNTDLAGCLTISLLAASLLGCSGGSIQGISGQGLDPATGEGTALQGTLGGVSSFQITGSGVCGKIQLDFGDGTPPTELSNVDFASPPTVRHTYSGWGGKKTVKAGSLENCSGAPELTFTVTPIPFKLGLAPPLPAQCNLVPGKPALRKNTRVHLTTFLGLNPATPPGAVSKIDFGCNGCSYDQDGAPGQAANDWPFPGLRPFSLVVSVGPDLYQGGTDVSFITKNAGPMQACVNESHLADQRGAWGVNIEVDESRAQ